jgi:hypothetical protein
MPAADGATSVQVLSSLGEIVVAATWRMGIGRILMIVSVSSLFVNRNWIR